MKRIPMLSAAVRALMFGMAFGIACTAAAQEKIVLRVADHLSLNHYVAPYQVKFWMQKVTEASGGKIQFEYYPAEQLGNATDYLKLVVAGVIDVSSNTPAYVSDKMPLSVVAELPGAFNTACVGTLAFWKLASNGGILDKEEFAPNGVRVLFSMVFSPYQIFTRKKFSRPEDFAGLKIQSSGGAKDLILRKIGAVPIRVTGPNIYESISRGTIDGGNLTYGSLISYNLQELAKFVTEGENFGSVVLNYVISEQRWMSLPPNVRQIMAEAGEATTRHSCAEMDKGVTSDAEKLRRFGITSVRFSAEEHAALGRSLSTVAKDWAENLDRSGKAGSAVLNAFQSAVAAQSR